MEARAYTGDNQKGPDQLHAMCADKSEPKRVTRPTGGDKER